MTTKRLERTRHLAVGIAGLMAASTPTASAQLLSWIEDGQVRSYCIESTAHDVIQLPDDAGFARDISVSSAGMTLATADGLFATPVTFQHGDVFGHGMKAIALSHAGGAPLASATVYATTEPERSVFWDSGSFDYRIESLTLDSRTSLPTAIRPFEYEIPPGSGIQIPTLTVDLFADSSALFRLLVDPNQSWLQVTGFDGPRTTVHPLAEPTWQIQVDENDLFVLDGDPFAMSVAVYLDYATPNALREVLLTSDDFGAHGRIGGIALEQRPSNKFGDLFVLHAGLISRLPRDGGPAEVVMELDPDMAPTRHRLHAVYMRPLACGRIFGDDDADGVLNWYDECTRTPIGTDVSPTGRPVADINEDCAVNLSDFSILQDGMTE